jgi:hypothetical protein
VSRSRFAVLGLGIALVGCDEKFVASLGSGGDSGFARAGQSGASALADAGESAGGSAGSDDSAGEGAKTGGTGGLLSHGGTGGGAPIEPMLPGGGLLLWLRADRGVQQKDGLVQTWQDQSGSQTHAMQASPNARPVYLADGFNGLPTLEFDGQGRFLKLPDGFGDFSQGLAAIVVAKPIKAECASMLEFSNGSEIEDIALGSWQNKWTYEVAAQFIQTGSVDPQRFSLYAVNHPVTGSAVLRIDGNVIETLDMALPVLPSSGIRENNFVGHTLYGNGCEYFQGQISEIILYSRTLRSEELNQIEKYLVAHWALREQDTPAPTP